MAMITLNFGAQRLGIQCDIFPKKIQTKIKNTKKKQLQNTNNPFAL
jgi:hypothetical protein